MLTITEYFSDLGTLSQQKRGNQIPGGNPEASDADFWDIGWGRIWEDTPDRPGYFYTPSKGPLVVNAPEKRVERVDTWEKMPDEKIIDYIKASGVSQVRQYSDQQKAADNLLQWETLLDQLHYEKMLVDLNVYSGDLELFDADIYSHPPADQAYAAYLVRLESENLSLNDQLIAAGGNDAGLYTPAEANSVRARISTNARVARSLQGGVSTPEGGPEREYVKLDGEEIAAALFYQEQRDVNTIPMWMPHVKLERIPDGVDTASVYLMVYDSNNTFLYGRALTQQPDGTWDVEWHASFARGGSPTFRCALTSGGTSSEYEITARTYVGTDNTPSIRVRWGGRNGVPVAGGERRRRSRKR